MKHAGFGLLFFWIGLRFFVTVSADAAAIKEASLTALRDESDTRVVRLLMESPEAPAKLAFERIDGAEIVIISSGGTRLRVVNLPPDSVRNLQTGRTYTLGRDKGFLSYPQSGDYFVWFPKLGQEVHFFDEAGSYLWTKPESRYLQVFPTGRLILASAGDHSRFFIAKPDLEPVVSVEGMTFVDFELNDAPGTAFQGCFAFLDGEAGFVGSEPAKTVRLQVEGILKSIGCDMAGRRAALHVWDNKRGRDGILLTDWPDEGDSTLSLGKMVALPAEYPETLALAYHPDGYAGVALPGTATTGVLILESAGKSWLWNSKTSDPEWRSVTHPAGIVFHSDTTIVIANQHGLQWERKFPRIDSVKVADDRLFIQIGNQVLGLWISKT